MGGWDVGNKKRELWDSGMMNECTEKGEVAGCLAWWEKCVQTRGGLFEIDKFTIHMRCCSSNSHDLLALEEAKD